MAATKNTKKKATPKQTKVVKPTEQITLEETIEKRPVKKNSELKAQREAREKREAEQQKKMAEIKKQEEEFRKKQAAEKLTTTPAPAPAPKKQKKPIAQEQQALKPRPEPAKTKKKKGKKRKGEERILKLSLDKSAPFMYQEAYKSLRTNLNFISSTSDVKSVIITSAIPRESKSNVAVNIAINMATEGKKVILVDCDLRKPVLHRYLRVGHHPNGLTDVLAGEASLEDAIVRFKDVKVHLLPAGTIPPNPSEMLSQERMKKLVEKLKETYDFVILDAPPVSVVTDAAVLGHYVDGAILVVRSKFAPKETVQLAKQKLENVDIKILGVVLTRYNAKNATKNSAYTYSYGYGYGYGYGDDDD